VKEVALKLKTDKISLSELNFYIFSAFLIRCKKEFQWHLIKTPYETVTLFSCKPAFLYVLMNQQISIVLQGKQYCFSSGDFTEYTEYLYQMLNTVHGFPDFDYHNLDPVFMEYMLCVDLPYLYAVKNEEIYLDDLRIYSGETESQQIKESKYFEMMKGEQIQNTITKTNLNQQTHEERVRLLLQNLETGFQPEESAIVVYNNSDIIRDGSHRAGWLYRKYGNIKIKILRMFFSRNYYKYSRYAMRTDFEYPPLLFSAVNSRWLKVNGKETRILRSSTLGNLELADRKRLHELSVETLIDLRCLKDYSQIDLLCQEFEYINIPLSYIMPSSDRPDLETECCYMHIISQAEQIRKILHTIINIKKNAAVFCAIGRDRTGVVCAVLQMLCGCSVSEIIQEYSISDQIYEHTDMGMQKGFSYEAAQMGMIRFLNAFFQKYHSIEQYLSCIGISSQEIAAIRNKLQN